MKLQIIYLNEILFLFHKAALHIAIEKGNLSIVQLLLNHNGIDVNNKSIILFKLFSLHLKNILFLIQFKN